MFQIKYNDAGRFLFAPQETNDCLVRCLALSIKIPYMKAHKYAERVMGRRKNMGVNPELGILGLCKLGFKLIKKNPNKNNGWNSSWPPTILSKLNKKKTYIVWQGNHVYVVVNRVNILDDITPSQFNDKKYVYQNDVIYGLFEVPESGLAGQTLSTLIE